MVFFVEILSKILILELLQIVYSSSLPAPLPLNFIYLLTFYPTPPPLKHPRPSFDEWSFIEYS